MRAVVHADKSNRQSSGLVSLIKQTCNKAHGVLGFSGTVCNVLLDNRHKLALGVLNGVALFGDGKADHLKTWVYGYLTETLHVVFVRRIRLQSLTYRCQNLGFYRAVRHQRDVKGEVVMLGEYPVDDFKVEGIRRDDSGGLDSRVKQSIL